jgi:hypothetical protein
MATWKQVRQLAAPLGDSVRVLSWIDSAERDRLLDASDVFRASLARRRDAEWRCSKPWPRACPPSSRRSVAFRTR